jgi:hypothetical protein
LNYVTKSISWFLILACSVLALSAQPAPQQPSRAILTNAVVIDMVKSGFSQNYVLTAITENRPQFTFDPASLTLLKNSGVSDEIVQAMVTRQHLVPAEVAPAPAPPVPVAPIPQPVTAPPVVNPNREQGYDKSNETLRHQFEVSGAVNVMRFPGAMPGNIYKVGFMVDASYNLVSRFAFTGLYTFNSKEESFTRCSTTRSPLFCATFGESVMVKPIQLGGRVNLINRGLAIPYLSGTIGVVRYGGRAWQDADYDALNYHSHDSYSTARTRFAFTVGSGVIIRPIKHFDVKPDLRFIKGMGTKWLPVLGVGLGFRI